jgi:hypothetical protein
LQLAGFERIRNVGLPAFAFMASVSDDSGSHGCRLNRCESKVMDDRRFEQRSKVLHQLARMRHTRQHAVECCEQRALSVSNMIESATVRSSVLAVAKAGPLLRPHHLNGAAAA